MFKESTNAIRNLYTSNKPFTQRSKNQYFEYEKFKDIKQ